MLVGQVVDDYEVLGTLAEGGMAEIFLVKHRVLGSTHVLKRLRPECARKPRLRTRFLSEGRVQAQLRHRHIVAVTDLVSSEDEAALIMDHLPGGSLADRLAALPHNLSPSEAAEVALPLLAALAFAHDRGVVHRDLKPDNVLFRDDSWYEPALSDFGIAKVHDDADIEGTRLVATKAGVTMGTPGYMAPEQIKATAAVGPPADVFAMGVLLWEMVLGVPPFVGATEYEVMDRIVQGRRPDLAELGADLPPAFRAVVERALESDPAARFASCAAFAEALRAATEGREADARVARITDRRRLRAQIEAALAAPSTAPLDDDVPDLPLSSLEPEEVARRAPPVTLAVGVGLLGAMALGGAILSALPLGADLHPASPLRPDHARTGLGGPVLQRTGYELVPITPGARTGVGSPEDEVGRDDDEGLAQAAVPPFAIGSTEVTQALWTAVMEDDPVRTRHQDWGGTTGSGHRCDRWGAGPTLPVVCVSWVEALQFANRLSELEGLRPAYTLGRTITWDRTADGYRLPTEVEWELAARADLASAYAPSRGAADVCGWGNVPSWMTAWKVGGDLPIDDPAPCSDPFLTVAPVSSFQPNAFGVFDTLGNVSEWVWDPYDRDGVAVAPVTERRRTTATVVRGGAWATPLHGQRTADREQGDPTQRSWLVGLRLARSL